MANHLLGLLITEHQLGRRQQPAECDFAKLLLLQELGNVHAHLQLLVSLADLAEELIAATGDKLYKRGAGDSVPGPQLGFDLEVKRRRMNIVLHLCREVEEVLDDVHFQCHLLPEDDYDVDHYIAGYG